MTNHPGMIKWLLIVIYFTQNEKLKRTIDIFAKFDIELIVAAFAEKLWDEFAIDVT